MSAVLKDAPLRPDIDRVTHLLGDHVVVTIAWYEANEAQLRHITQAALEAEREREAMKRRLDAMLPLFQEARDALPAIPLTAAKLHGIDLTLADRMDGVGIPERWKAREERDAEAKTRRQSEAA